MRTIYDCFANVCRPLRLYTICVVTVHAGSKENPGLLIKTNEIIHRTHTHCKRLIITSTDSVLCLYSLLYEKALPILYIWCCELTYTHF